MSDSATSCSGPPDDVYNGSVGLRIGAIFVILVTSAFGTLTPILTRKVNKLKAPAWLYDFIKYFGSGVIIATAFIHLLSPGSEELGSLCLNTNFQNYPFAFAFSMIAVFATFVVNVVAFRLGSSIAQKLAYDPSMGGHHHAAEHNGTPVNATDRLAEEGAAPVLDTAPTVATTESDQRRKETSTPSSSEVSLVEKVGMSAAASQILGVAILEFGVIFHSVIIGITLGATTDFTILFIVIIFHQMFEGLGLGSRLALLPLAKGSLIPYLGAIAYSCVTPIGIAIGIGIRTTFNGDSAKANYITGTFDSVSSGILLYTGLVELLAHEFIFNDRIRTDTPKRLTINILEILVGAGIMALLGRWA